MRKRFMRMRVAVGVSVIAASAMIGGFATGSAGASTPKLTASAPGITPTTIKIGILTDQTGAASSSFGTAAQAIEARFKQLNAEGGIDGRKIVWVTADAASSPTGAETAAQNLVENQGVFAITELSSAFFGAAPYLNKEDVPVTGTGLDGSEWDQQPNTNLFSITGDGSVNGDAYDDGGFYKSIGVHKFTYVESNVPSAISFGNGVYKTVEKDGLKPCDKTIVPLGSVDFTAFALSFKADGCDTAECACVLSSSLAMATALHQAGLNNVKILFAAGPTQDIFQSKADEAAAKGAYFPGISSSPTYTNAASVAFLADLKKYDPAYQGGLPGNSESDGWPAANLMVQGLEVAGTNPTRQSFIAGLRKVTNWTDSGLATGPISFAHFGQNPPTQCFSYVQFNGKEYVPYPKSGKAFCGKEIPGTAS